MRIKLRRVDNNDEKEFNYNVSVEECREQIESFCNGTNCCWVSFEVQYKTASEQPIFAMCRHNFEKKAEELFYTSPSESGKIVNEYWKCSKCNLIKQ